MQSAVIGVGSGQGKLGSGAGYGGMGGSMLNTTGGGMYYGSVTNPVDWGSAATHVESDTSVYGGGVIKIECSGTATIDGRCSNGRIFKFLL